MRSFFPSELKFCDLVNVATVFSFLYIPSVPEIKGNVPLFLASTYRECVFSLKAYLGGVMDLRLLRNFYFVFVLLCKNRRKDVREVGIKNNFSPCRHFTKWVFLCNYLAVSCSYLITRIVRQILRNFRLD